jgi:hypothetical protein
LRTATRNLSPESSAQSKDFNLKRVLFCRGTHGRLFQQNRSLSAGQVRDGQVECKWVGKSVRLPNCHHEAVIDHHDVNIDHVAQVVETVSPIKSTYPHNGTSG